MRKVSVILAAVAVLAALVGAAFAGSNVAAKTRVTIKGPNGDFEGKIFSKRKKCLGHRRVKVYKQKGSEQNRSADKKIAEDTSERRGDHGEWSVGNTGFKKGRFYARAARSPGCRAGSSKTIRISS